MSTNHDNDLLALQLDVLFDAAPAAMMGGFGMFMVAMVYWSPETAAPLSAWIALFMLFSTAPVLQARLRKTTFYATSPLRHWLRVVDATYFLIGTTLGAGCAVLIAYGTAEQAIVPICLVLGGVIVTFPVSVRPLAFGLYYVPAFLLIAIGVLASNLQFRALLAIGAVVLCVVVTVVAKHIGHQLALVLSLGNRNRVLVQQLEEANRDLMVQSATDPLTGLANRRGLMAFLLGARGPHGLLLIDIDFFKSYNDSFGHAEGDDCLKAVAACLRDGIDPKNEIAVRQGGEEFVVVVAAKSPSEVALRAEAMRAAVAALSRRSPSPVQRPVTVSIGCDWSPDMAATTSVADRLSAADEALYRAKREGRNCVRFPSDPPAEAKVA
jgi:diguanylate cyclase (GGDEF)-like protein